MNQPLPKTENPETTAELPADLPASTVSEIASWLVGQPLDAVEREMIRHTLESCGGDRALAASVLGISLPALRKKIRAYAVRREALPDSFEPAKEAPRAANDETSGLASAEEAAPKALAEAATEPPAETVVEEIVEPAPTLAVPDADNDPSLTLVQTEAVSAPAAVQAEPELVAAPEIVPAVVAEVAAEPAAAVTPEEAAAETPKLIDGIAAPRPKQRKNYTGPAVAGSLTLLVAAPIAYGLLTTQEKSNAIDVDRNRLEVTAIGSPRLEQRIQVPVWTAPATRTQQGMPVDIAADRRGPASAATVTAAAPGPAPEPAAPAAPVAAETASEPAPLQTVADFNAEFDTEMDLGPVSIAAGLAMDLGPVNRLADVRMEPGPVNVAADARMDSGPADVLADLRMELAPETTGSIPAPTFFVAPKDAPTPLARLEPSAERPVVRRPARAAPPQPELPSPGEVLPRLFPFNLFVPKGTQTGVEGTGALALHPVDCCIR